MHGNVHEWCLDSWHENYQGAPTDGSAWINETSEHRIVRSGYWCSDLDETRSASRSYKSHDYDLSIGFRCVVTKT